MTTPRKTLTDGYAAAARPGTTTQDTKQPGLRLVVSPKGKAVWQFYAWNPATQKPLNRVLGVVGEMPVKQARAAAAALQADTHSDEAKARAKADASAVPTLRYLVEAYNVAGMTEHIERNFGDWLDMPIDQITPQMVLARQTKILHRAKARSAQRGKVRANPGGAALGLAAKWLRSLYNFANEKRLYFGENLGRLLELEKVEPRRVWLKGTQLDDLLRVLDNWEAHGLASWSQPFFKLMLFTGIRGGALRQSKWSWIDWTEKTLTVPATVSKNRLDNVVHLSAKAVEVLKAWQAAAPASQFVFPAHRDVKRHVSNSRFQWLRAREAAGLGDVSPHDLRRTFGSQLVNLGVPVKTIAVLMNHKTSKVTEEVYAHILDATLKDAVEKL